MRCAEEPWVKLSGLTRPGPSLQTVVSDSGGDLEAGAHVGIVDDLTLGGFVTPDTGVTIGL